MWAGRQPYLLAAMLQVYGSQVTHNPSDPMMEETFLEIYSVHQFAGLVLQRVPNENTTLRLRHLLDAHDLGDALLAELNRILAAQGFRLQKGTIVDASIITAPTSTKNQRGTRDPEMYSTGKATNGFSV